MSALSPSADTVERERPAAKHRGNGRLGAVADGWGGPLATAGCALGMVIVALAYYGARRSQAPWADAALWAGLAVMVLAVGLRLLAAGASREERLWLAILLGLALYAVKVMLSPSWFSLHDELGQYRSTADILRTGRLFTPNPEDAAYSAYFGILAAAGALARLTGLGITPSGLILIGVARVMLCGGLFLFVERVTSSDRIAGLTVLLYAANPNFVFFDSQFAYESLALGMGAVVLWLAARAADPDLTSWGEATVAALLMAALIVTHHLTSYAVCIVLLAWSLFALIAGARKGSVVRLWLLTAVAVTLTGLWALHTWRATDADIGGSIIGSFSGLIHVLSGTSSGRHPFSAVKGHPVPPLEQYTGLLSVALLMAAWPFALWGCWRERRRRPAVIVLGLVALSYPASLALRLTAAGTETSNRTSEFVFVGLGAAIAIACGAFLLPRVDRGGRWGVALLAALAVYVGLVFVGGIEVGTASYDELPGPYQVSADLRSIDPEGVAAARWAGRWLPAGRYFFADAEDQSMVIAYSRLHQQSGFAAGQPLGWVFAYTTFNARTRTLIRFDKIRYLIVDLRDSTQLPYSGHYFDGADPLTDVGIYRHPIPRAALTKFDTTSCLERIFSSGNVAIYDTEGLLTGRCGS